MVHTTHPSLLARLADGVDPEAWSEFYSRYGDLIRGVASRYGLQQADADDLAQEVVLGLTRSLGNLRYDPAKGKFRSYLRTTVVHAIYRKLGQNNGDHPLPEDQEDLPGDGDPEEVWEEEWKRYHVRRAMQELRSRFSERDRIAFVRYAIRGEPAATIAEDLGMTLEQLYQVKSRILKRLTGRIAKQVEEEG